LRAEFVAKRLPGATRCTAAAGGTGDGCGLVGRAGLACSAGHGRANLAGMRTTIRASALFFAVAAGLLAPAARARGPRDLEIGVQAGAGTVPGGGSGPTPLGFGLGGRAGVAIFGLYGGLSLVNYFGESQTVGPFKTSAKSLMYGVEGGYGSS